MEWPKLVFTAINWLWYLFGVGCIVTAAIFTLRRKAFTQLEQKLQETKGSHWIDPIAIALWGVCVPVVVILGRLAQYGNFQLTGDSGYTLNLGWTFAHGYGLRASSIGELPIFAFHFYLNTPLYSPLLWIWNSPVVYCITQGAATGLSLLAVYCLAKRRIKNPIMPHLAALMAMAHPIFKDLATTVLEDSVYAPVFFLWAVYFCESEQWLPALATGLLALGTKEEAPFMLFGMGLYLLLQRQRRQRLLGISSMVVASALWLGEVTFMHKTKAQWPLCSNAWSLFQRIGGSPAEIIKEAFHRPWAIALSFIVPFGQWLVIAKDLMLAGLFPLVAGAAFVPFLVTILPHVLSEPGSNYHNLLSYYGAFACGPLFWALIIGIQKAMTRIPQKYHYCLASYILLIAGCGFMTRQSYRNGLMPSNWYIAVPAAMAQIPPDAKVWCDGNLFSNCAMRRYVKLLPSVLPDCIFDNGLFMPDRVLLSLYWTKVSDPATVRRIMDFLKRKKFEVVFQDKDLVLLANPASHLGDSAKMDRHSAMNKLFRFDEAMRSKHQARFLIGIDEVGRGPLAGPVVSAAVVLEFPFSPELKSVRDSKVLTPLARERLFGTIRRLSVSSAVAWAHSGEIDRYNIFQASLMSMRRAFERLRLDIAQCVVVVDGPWKIPGVDCRQEPVIGGDAKSLSVACASVIAKVVRDRWMERLHHQYPGYGFASHKGYGTERHLKALNQLGPSPIHRTSFEPVARLLRAASLA